LPAAFGHFGITIGSYVTSIGPVTADIPRDMVYTDRFAAAESNDMRCPLPEAAAAMRAHIWEIMQAKDTVGGIFEVVALGVPPGLGSHVHWDRRLDGLLMGSVGSIHAIKGVEVGPAFAGSEQPGTAVHDEIFLAEDGDRLVRRTNNSGGFEGGITTGEPVIVRAAMKPISTVLNPRRSVNLATGETAETVYERSDFCAVPRAAVVSVRPWWLSPWLTALLQKLGGDSIAEMEPRFAACARRGLL
jgi:chorismate synthase